MTTTDQIIDAAETYPGDMEPVMIALHDALRDLPLSPADVDTLDAIAARMDDRDKENPYWSAGASDDLNDLAAMHRRYTAVIG